MKLIQCIIRLEKLEEAVQQLAKWTPGLTVTHVRESGEEERISVYRGAQYRVLSPKIMIELAADDNKVDDLVRILIEIGRNGSADQGRIFVVPVEQAYHVRTGFMD
jgi:nitrogen regulatory protein PII